MALGGESEGGGGVMGSEREELSLGFEGVGQDQSSFLAFAAMGLEPDATSGFHRTSKVSSVQLIALPDRLQPSASYTPASAGDLYI